ncbi:histidine phosphatase family protein [Nocardioides sp. KIGAM211]|uniref:Histidine phosphatase family protein n=1 Tax=Nocardioides luti TaxID=2761101 RepID=A0A7X0VBK8_9ACTN|nr:histidine phosphatase family protein [Nocardioides luti]MBB6628077.1 histidine phosphatase family protein [Nocardioides luti]
MGVVLLVRHGQASFGAEDYDVLSETGWEQARLLGRHLAAAGVRPDAVVRGGMRRHRETAEGLLEGAGWTTPPEEDTDWDEFDHLGVVAAYPDLPTHELDRREFQHVFELATARWTSGEHDADYPEPFGGFSGRVGAALARAQERAGSGRTVVVISSGGPIAACCGALVAPEPTGEPDPALTWALWGRFNTVVVNTSVTRVVVGSTGARLLTFNEHAHLAGDTLTYR